MRFKLSKYFIFIFGFILIISFLASYSDLTFTNSDQNNDDEEKPIIQEEKPILKSSQSSPTEYTGIGKAQNISAYGEGNFINFGMNVSNNDNAYIIVPNEWNASKITCNISNIYEYDTQWVNGTFDTGFDSSLWTNHTNFRENVTFGWHESISDSNDSIYIRFDEAYQGVWNYVEAYWNLTFTVPRNHNPIEDWQLNFNYRYIYTDPDWLTITGGTKNFFEIQNSGYSTGTDVYKKMTDITNNTWEAYNRSISPSTYNFQLPGKINLLLGLRYGQTSAYNPTGYLEMYFDNISLEIPTLPKPSQINLSINDITNGERTEVDDAVGPVSGTINLQNNWDGGLGGKDHYFNFSSNSTGDVILNSEFFVIAQSLEKTQIEEVLEGSEFIVENNTKTTWTQYFSVSIPGTYSQNYYFNMSKPVNWIVTELINPYGANKINDVIATAGYGNTTLTVPNNIILNGRWKIVAEAPNYVDEAKIFNKVAPVWQENNIFQLPEKIKINASIDTANNPNIDTTNASLFIYYPNGTLWYQEIASVNDSGNVQFSELILGETNTSRGKYSAQIIWNDHDLNMSQVGFSQFNFVVWHHTSLSAIESNFEKIAGEPFVIRVNFTDEDLDTFIGFANVFYNTSYGEHGVAVYSGSGIYIIDVDTSFLSVGDYFFSFNTSNSFYENLSISNLIQLTIREDFIALEVPRDVLTVEANTYAIFQFNLSGEEFGAPISTDNVSTDWHLDYEIKEYNIGNYTLNVSTFEVTSGSVPETFYINIYANKTFQGSTSDFVVLTVYPIDAVVNINTTFVQVPLNHNFSVKVNYTVKATGKIISGANCSVIWDSSYNIIKIGDEFIIKFNASGLTSDSYIVFVILEHKGYETIYKSINVIVLPQSSELLILNEPLDFINGDMVNITCRFHSDGKNIENANLTFIGDLSADLSWNGSVYYYTLNTTEFLFKSYFIQVYATATNYQSQLKETLFSVSPLVVEIQTISRFVNYIPGEDKNITVTIDDQSHGGIITSLNVSYELGTKSDFLLLLPDGSFALNLSDLNLSPATQTAYQLKITVINPYGNNDEIFITIVVSGSQSGVVPSVDDDNDSKTKTEIDYSLVVIAVIITGIVIAGGFASLTAYKKVMKNRELKKERLHNKFLDAFNLNNVIVINKKSGLNVYEQFFAGKKMDATLISGFLDAIRAFGIELTSAYEQSQSISLEYKDSKILMSEFKDFRLIFILKDRPSEEFLKSVTTLSYDIDRDYGELLEKFAGNLAPFAGIKGLIEHHLNTSFISPLKIVDIKGIELSPAEISLVQKAKSLMKQNKLDYFFTTFLMPEQAYDPKRTQLIFKLIEKKVFQPTDISFS